MNGGYNEMSWPRPKLKKKYTYTHTWRVVGRESERAHRSLLVIRTWEFVCQCALSLSLFSSIQSTCHSSSLPVSFTFRRFCSLSRSLVGRMCVCVCVWCCRHRSDTTTRTTPFSSAWRGVRGPASAEKHFPLHMHYMTLPFRAVYQQKSRLSECRQWVRRATFHRIWLFAIRAKLSCPFSASLLAIKRTKQRMISSVCAHDIRIAIYPTYAACTIRQHLFTGPAQMSITIVYVRCRTFAH